MVVIVTACLTPVSFPSIRHDGLALFVSAGLASRAADPSGAAFFDVDCSIPVDRGREAMVKFIDDELPTSCPDSEPRPLRAMTRTAAYGQDNRSPLASAGMPRSAVTEWLDHGQPPSGRTRPATEGGGAFKERRMTGRPRYNG